MPVDERTLHALQRIANVCIEIAGDAPKGDLILVASKVGFTDEELHKNFPEFYRSSEPVEPEEMEPETETEEPEETEEK